jgi:hypothetical protein
MDVFVVPTLSFPLLYGFLILRHHRRRIMWLGVTANPTAEWIARQLMEACGWEAAPDYVVRDRDCVYGEAYVQRLRAMGIRNRPMAPQSPWQNAYAERLIVLDQVRGARPCRCAWRTAPSARTAIVHEISQRGPHASVAGQGRTDSAQSSKRRTDIRKATSRRTASPIRSDLICDRDSCRPVAVELHGLPDLFC